MKNDNVGSVSLELRANTSAFFKEIKSAVQSVESAFTKAGKTMDSDFTKSGKAMESSISGNIKNITRQVNEYQKELDKITAKQDSIIYETISSYKSMKLPYSDKLIDKDISSNADYSKLETQWNKVNSKLDLYKQKLNEVMAQEKVKSAVSEMSKQLEANKILSLISSQEEYNQILKYTKNRMQDIEKVAKNTSAKTGVDVNELLKANNEYQKLAEQQKVLVNNQDRFSNSTGNVTQKLQDMFDKGISGLTKMSKSSNETVSSIGNNLLPKMQSIAPAFTKIAGAIGVVSNAVGILTTTVKLLYSLMKKANELANKVLKEAKKRVDEFVTATKKAIDVVKLLTGQSDKFKDKWSNSLRTIGYLVATVFSIRAIYNFGKASVEVAKETQNAWIGLNSIITGQGKSFEDAQGFINKYVSDGLIPLNEAVTSYKNLISAGYAEKESQDIMNRLKDSASFGRQAHLDLGNAVRGATEGIKNQNSTLVDNAGVTKNLSVMYAEYAKQIGKGANSLTEAEKRTATYNGIMKETTHQVGDASKIAQTFSGKVARLSATFTDLKNAIGNVVIPILELFIPAIQKAMEQLTQFFNRVAEIMAQFGVKMKTISEISGNSIGKVGSEALQTAEDIAGTGTVAEETAKKINNAFNSVDEINVLDTSKEKDNGNSSIGSGTSSDNDLKNAIDTVKEGSTILDQFKSKAFEFGKVLAEKLNESLSGINWDGIKAKTKNIATNIADFLNGFLYNANWTLIGQTIADGINTALIFANTLVTTFDFKKFGESLATMINGAIWQIDWELLGETIANWFNISIDTFFGFVKTLDWAGLGYNIADGLNSTIKNIHWDNIKDGLIKGIGGVAKTIKEFVLNFKWDELWDNIINTINGLIESGKIGELAKSISDFLVKALEGVVKLAKEIKWKDLIDQVLENVDFGELIYNYVKLKNEIFKIKIQLVIKLLWETFKGALWSYLYSVGESVWNDITKWVDDTFIQPIKDIFDSKNILELGANLVKGLFKGISGMVVGLPTMLGKILVTPIIEAVKFLFGISSPSKVFAEIGVFLIEGLFGGIKGTIKNVSKWLNDNVVQPILKGIGGIVTGALSLGKKLIENVYKGIAEKKKWLTDKWAGVKKWFTDIKATASIKIATTKKWVQDKWKELTSAWKDKTVDLKAKIATKWNDLKNGWNRLMNNFKDKTVKITASIVAVKEGIKGWINSKLIEPLNKAIKWTGLKVPKLAQGGWFEANNPQLAIVGEGKSNEIVAPEEKIKSQVKEALSEMGLGISNRSGNGKIDITLRMEYPDGRTLIKTINNYQISQNKILLMT